MSSKASGEPCLMLSAGVLAALQSAVAAARAEVSGTSKVRWSSGFVAQSQLLDARQGWYHWLCNERPRADAVSAIMTGAEVAGSWLLAMAMQDGRCRHTAKLHTESCTCT